MLLKDHDKMMMTTSKECTRPQTTADRQGRVATCRKQRGEARRWVCEAVLCLNIDAGTCGDLYGGIRMESA